MSWDSPHERDRVCVWCGIEIRGGQMSTTDHGGPYHARCLPPLPQEIAEKVARLVLASR